MPSSTTPPRHSNDTATLCTTNTSLESNHQTHVKTVVPEPKSNNDITQNPVSVALNTPTLSLCDQTINNLQQVILSLKKKKKVEKLQAETFRMANEICSLKSRFDSKTTQEHFCPHRREHVQPETPRSSTTQKTRQPTTPTSTTTCQGSSETKSSNNERRSSISSASDGSSPDLPTPSAKLSIPIQDCHTLSPPAATDSLRPAYSSTTNCKTPVSISGDGHHSRSAADGSNTKSSQRQSPRDILSRLTITKRARRLLVGDSIIRYVHPRGLTFKVGFMQKLCVPGMKAKDMLHWMEEQDTSANILQVVIHVGLSDCRNEDNIIWSEIIACAKRIFPKASVSFSSILPVRNNQDLNQIISFTNRRLESSCYQAGAIFINNHETFSIPSKQELYTDQFHLTKSGTRKLAINIKKTSCSSVQTLPPTKNRDVLRPSQSQYEHSFNHHGPSNRWRRQHASSSFSLRSDERQLSPTQYLGQNLISGG